MTPQPPGRIKTAILISGRGSNMMALVEAARASDYPAEIALVLSNRPEAPGLAWARDQDIPTGIVDHRTFPDREAFEAALQGMLLEHQIACIALAGFMRVLTAPFVEQWAGRMINIHPSLLPDFKGLNTYERALAAGVARSGCTVHFVEPEMDSGPIIVQAPVAIERDDTPDGLAARILRQEHRIYPLALGWVTSGRIKLDNGVVTVRGTLGVDADGVDAGSDTVVPALSCNTRS
ncbi:MAG: phosphoribosylglycinamide formyltransferase [Pseudomonadota bacterium]